MKAYTTKSGAVQYKPSFKSLESHIKRSSYSGYCLSCGKLAHHVEPDARQYTCVKCGKDKVYGSEELMIMGLFHY